ncbi:MAG: hypothetical protein IT284_00300 [Bacteroidetes bacterium]|nr:hypothetical protein [Bacteroidota bacterium]
MEPEQEKNENMKSSSSKGVIAFVVIIALALVYFFVKRDDSKMENTQMTSGEQSSVSDMSVDEETSQNIEADLNSFDPSFDDVNFDGTEF